MKTERHDLISGIDKALIDEALDWRAFMDEDIIDGEKKAAFHAWVMADPSHMQAFDYAERFWEQLRFVSDPLDPRTDASANAPEPGPSERRRSIKSVAAFAGFAVVAFGTTVAILDRSTTSTNEPPAITYQTDIAEFRSVELPDGSRVVIGPGSRVEAHIDDTQRGVALLDGEAYFDVKEDAARPFSVVAGTVSISVVGTQFEVRTSSEQTKIAVADGRVEVEFAGADPDGLSEEAVALNRGQSVIVDRRKIGTVSPINTELVGAWRQNRLTFDNEPLARVVTQVNRYDRREITLADRELATLTISATLDAGDIDALLQTLSEIYPVVITKQGASQLVITKRK